jgi:hypothetical protein
MDLAGGIGDSNARQCQMQDMTALMADTHALACADASSTARRKILAGSGRIVRQCMTALAFGINGRAQVGGYLYCRTPLGQGHRQPL